MAEEAQVQPAPPLERPVAAPGVAAEPAEQAGDVPVEIDGRSADPSGRRTGSASPPATAAAATAAPGVPSRTTRRTIVSSARLTRCSLRLQHEGHSSVFPSGSVSFRLAVVKPSAETVTFTSRSGRSWTSGSGRRTARPGCASVLSPAHDVRLSSSRFGLGSVYSTVALKSLIC